MKKEDFKVRDRKRIFQGNILTLDLEEVEFPNGAVRSRELIRHPGAVGIVPITAEQDVLLVRQYRHPIRGFVLEIPAGIPDAGESAEDCARRELEEETGTKAKSLTKLAEFFTTPGYSDEFFHLFLAEAGEMGAQKLDSDEFLEVIKVPIDRARQMVESQDIQDAKTIIGVLLAVRFVNSA